MRISDSHNSPVLLRCIPQAPGHFMWSSKCTRFLTIRRSGVYVRGT